MDTSAASNADAMRKRAMFLFLQTSSGFWFVAERSDATTRSREFGSDRHHDTGRRCPRGRVADRFLAVLRIYEEPRNVRESGGAGPAEGPGDRAAAPLFRVLFFES